MLRGRAGEAYMKLIKFISECEVVISSSYDILDTNIEVEHTFYSGDEIPVELVIDRNDGTSDVYFEDGTAANIPTDLFFFTIVKDKK